MASIESIAAKPNLDPSAAVPNTPAGQSAAQVPNKDGILHRISSIFAQAQEWIALGVFVIGISGTIAVMVTYSVWWVIGALYVTALATLGIMYIDMTDDIFQSGDEAISRDGSAALNLGGGIPADNGAGVFPQGEKNADLMRGVQELCQKRKINMRELCQNIPYIRKGVPNFVSLLVNLPKEKDEVEELFDYLARRVIKSTEYQKAADLSTLPSPHFGSIRLATEEYVLQLRNRATMLQNRSAVRKTYQDNVTQRADWLEHNVLGEFDVLCTVDDGSCLFHSIAIEILLNIAEHRADRQRIIADLTDKIVPFLPKAPLGVAENSLPAEQRARLQYTKRWNDLLASLNHEDKSLEEMLATSGELNFLLRHLTHEFFKQKTESPINYERRRWRRMIIAQRDEPRMLGKGALPSSMPVDMPFQHMQLDIVGEYLENLAKPHEWGGYLEVEALTEIFRGLFKFVIKSPAMGAQQDQSEAELPLRILFFPGHYMALIPAKSEILADRYLPPPERDKAGNTAKWGSFAKNAGRSEDSAAEHANTIDAWREDKVVDLEAAERSYGPINQYD